MKREKRDTRAEDSPAWRRYVMDPGSIPVFEEDCPCTKKKCERHGKCRECYDYHAAGKRLPYCLR